MAYVSVPGYYTDSLYFIKCGFLTASLTIILINPGEFWFTNNPFHIFKYKMFSM